VGTDDCTSRRWLGDGLVVGDGSTGSATENVISTSVVFNCQLQIPMWWLEHHTSPNIPWEDLTYFNRKKPSVGAALDSLASGFDCEAPSIGWPLRCGKGPHMMRRCPYGGEMTLGAGETRRKFWQD
jgi:hypothetical protein